MLGRANRLHTGADFKNVEEKGELYQFPDFGMVILDRKDNEPSRFGFVVSTKISKEAVDRNRIKRVIREVIRTSMVNIKNGFDVVFLAKPSITKVFTSDLMKEVRDSLAERKLLK